MAIAERKRDTVSSMRASRECGTLDQVIDRGTWNDTGRELRLSPRQIQIARLVCEGLTHDALAARLGITRNTVRVHLRRLYTRLGVRDRVTLLVRFLRVGRREERKAE